MGIEDASTHATACVTLLNAGNLAGALTYCATQGVEPPQCSLTAESPNAHKLRMLAMNHLTSEAWWRKRLTIMARRIAEMEHIRLQHTG